jgi:hypothetical protein
MPAVKEDSDVMVPVQEDERSLTSNNEVGIDELRNLGEDEQLNPKTSSSNTP